MKSEFVTGTFVNLSRMILKEGKVCAQGTHSEMLKNSSDYANMIQLQVESSHWVLG